MSTVAALLVLVAACTPAAPSPSAAPANATEVPKPKPSTQAPAAAPASPAASPAVAAGVPSAVASPAAKPAPSEQAPFNEQAVADFYQGKAIHIVVGFAAGGGYDTFARLIARYLGKYVPGNPSVIVDNVPGAGSLIAANQVYNNAPKDGTTIGSSSGALYLQQLFGNPGVQFDGTKQNYLGVPTSTTSYYMTLVHKRAGITKFDEVLGPNGKQLILGGESPGIGTHDGAVLMKEVLGANIKLVSGYQGTAPLRAALEQGEIDGFMNGWDSVKLTQMEQLKSGELLVLNTWSTEPTPDFPNVPTVLSFAKTEEERQLLTYGVILPNVISRPYVLAPEVPQDRVRALQAAFLKTVADKDFLADAGKANIDLSPLSGDEVRKRVDELFSMPPNVKARLKELIGG